MLSFLASGEEKNKIITGFGYYSNRGYVSGSLIVIDNKAKYPTVEGVSFVFLPQTPHIYYYSYIV